MDKHAVGKVQGVLRKYRPLEVYALLLVTFYFLFMDWEIGDRLSLYDFQASPISQLITGIGDLTISSSDHIYWSVVILYWFVGITRANKISNFIWQSPEELR